MLESSDSGFERRDKRHLPSTHALSVQSSNHRMRLSYLIHFYADPSQAGVLFMLFMFAMACSKVHCCK